MPKELSVSASLSFSKNGATISGTTASSGTLGSSTGGIDVNGKHFVKATTVVSNSDVALDKDNIGTLGYIFLRNLASQGVPDEAVVTLATAGTPGSTTNKYRVVGRFTDGSKSVSVEVTIATSNATLNGTNYNIITWTSVGADAYDVYRTSAGGTPSTTGKIATGATSPYNDQGAAGDSSTVPAEISSLKQIGIDAVTHTNLSDYLLQLKGGEYSVLRWNQAAVHAHAYGGNTEVEHTFIED